MVHYDKRLSLSDLAGADIVLTTYGVVVAEHGGAQEHTPKPETRNSKTKTRNPKPETRSSVGVRGE